MSPLTRGLRPPSIRRAALTAAACALLAACTPDKTRTASVTVDCAGNGCGRKGLLLLSVAGIGPDLLGSSALPGVTLSTAGGIAATVTYTDPQTTGYPCCVVEGFLDVHFDGRIEPGDVVPSRGPVPFTDPNPVVLTLDFTLSDAPLPQP